MPEPRTGPPLHAAAHLGWRYEVLVDDPGPPPRRPAPDERTEVSPAWVEAQRGTEATTNRPLVVALWALGGFALLGVVLWPLRVLPGVLSLAVVLACLVVAVPIGVALLQSRGVMAERLAAERARLDAERRAAEGELRRRQEEHARAHTAWRTRMRAYEAQPRWYGLRVPEDAVAVVVAGGTDAGWSALLTGIGAARLSTGGDLTVIDLSGRAVAGDLAALVRRCGVVPRVWVLPADLPRMNLGSGLDAEARARTLAAVAAAFDPAADTAADTELLRCVLEALGADAGVGAVIGGLRALTIAEGEEDPEDDPALSLLTKEEREQVRKRCGTGREQIDRAWELERHLAPFEGVGAKSEAEPYAQVKIIATDRAAGGTAARAYGAYTTAALCRLLEMGRPSGRGRWARTIMVCGAEALSRAEQDALIAAAETAGTGLVLFSTAPEIDRLEDARVHPVLMRPPDAEAAELLAGWLSDPQELALHRMTEVIGEALSGTIADSYVEDVHPGQAVTAPVAVRGAASSIAPLDLARNLRAATSWGRATAQASEMGGAAPGSRDPDTGPGAAADGPSTSESATGPEKGGRARAGGAVRPYRADAHGLRALPPTAMIVPGADGPLLADANPGILILPTATLSTVEDGPPAPAPAPEPAPGGDAPPPNIGPPPERLDWRADAQ